MYQLNASINSTNYMHQLYASDLPQSSVRTTFYPFGHPSRRKKICLQYTVLLLYMGLRKKLNWYSVRSLPKYRNIFSFPATALL